MFWKYTLFESKLALKNRKNWVIALFFLTIFTLLFMYTSREDDPESLYDEKVEEAKEMRATYHYMDELRFDDEDVAEVYDLITEEASLINFQKFYLGQGDDPEGYIENGLELNKLRLQVHELGNAGMPGHLIVPVDEILREDALLKYIQENDLPLESESFLTGYYFEKAFKAISGMLFFLVVLIAGSEMLTFEQRHESIFNGFPIPFMQKVASKVLIQFIYISILLFAGFYIGITYLKDKLELFDTDFPILIYSNGYYEAVSISQYAMYMLFAFLLIIIITLLGAVLCNMIFKNAFATILAGLGVFIIPYLMMLAGWKVPILSFIIYLDFFNVLAGEASMNLQYTSIDYIHGYIWLTGVIILLIGVIYAFHKGSYYKRREKETKHAA